MSITTCNSGTVQILETYDIKTSEKRNSAESTDLLTAIAMRRDIKKQMNSLILAAIYQHPSSAGLVN